jgi:hypothetical protein
MNKHTWNRLYYRCVRIMWRHPSAEQARIKKAWLAVMSRRTGTCCFFVRWN